MHLRRVLLLLWSGASLIWLAVVSFRLLSNCNPYTGLETFCADWPGGDLGSQLGENLTLIAIVGICFPLFVFGFGFAVARLAGWLWNSQR